MPYIPTKETKAENARRTAKALSDDELIQTTALSDEELMGEVGESDFPDTSNRTWAEWGRDTIGEIIPDEVLAAGGTVLGQGSYDENMKTVEQNRKKTLRPDDDRTLAETRQGYILNGLNNALFGFGDEVVAGGGALLGQGDYEKNLKDVEGKRERYRKMENDWSLGNIGSGAAGFIGGTPLFTGLYKGAQGAIRGARSLPSVVRGAPVLASAPTSTVGKVAETVGALGITGGAAGEISASGNATGGIGQRVGVIGDDAMRVATNTILGGAIGAAAPAATKAGQAMRNIIRDPKNKAARYLAEKFLASGKSIDDFADEYFGVAAGGKPVAPIDVAPTSVKDAGAAAARMPGSGRDRAQEFLKTRQEGMGARVGDDLQEALGKPPGSFVQTSDEIAAARAAESKPHYDKAFSSPKPVATPRIVELTNRPSGKQALNQGLKMAQDEGIPMSELVITDAKGNVVGYTLKALHYGKMALDDMIDSAVRSGNNQAARNLTTMKKQWLQEMDAVSPDYARGRGIYAGHAANQRAMDMGRKSVLVHPDQAAKEMAGMSASEREFYRQGFMQKVTEQIENAPDKGNMVNRIFGTKTKRDRMKAILGEERYNELAKKFDVENKMYDTYGKVNVGSDTAQRMAAQQDLNDGIAAISPEAATGFGRSMAGGSLMPLLNSIGWSRFVGILNGIGEKTRSEIVKLLFSTDPAEVRAGMALLNKHYAAAQRAQQVRQGVGAASAGNENTRTYGGGAVVLGTKEAGQAVAPYVPGI